MHSWSPPRIDLTSGPPEQSEYWLKEALGRTRRVDTRHGRPRSSLDGQRTIDDAMGSPDRHPRGYAFVGGTTGRTHGTLLTGARRLRRSRGSHSLGLRGHATRGLGHSYVGGALALLGKAGRWLPWRCARADPDGSEQGKYFENLIECSLDVYLFHQ